MYVPFLLFQLKRKRNCRREISLLTNRLVISATIRSSNGVESVIDIGQRKKRGGPARIHKKKENGEKRPSRPASHSNCEKLEVDSLLLCIPHSSSRALDF